MAINVAYIHGIGEIGGAEKDLLSYLELLDRNKFSPYVVCPASGPLKAEVEKLLVPVMSCSLPPWRKWRHVLQRHWALRELINILRQWNIDLVHVNDYWWAPLGYLASQKCHLPVVVHIRQQIEKSRVPQYWLTKPDRLFPVSQDIKRVLHNMEVEPGRARVVYSGIDVRHACDAQARNVFRKRHGLNRDQLVIGTVANLFPRKGYEYLIEALPMIKNEYPDIRCFIVGEGPESYQVQLVRLVKEKELESHVVFVGFQPNVFEFINAFDVFVLPSILEGFGIVLLEAMAMSKPIVATRVGGVPEVIDHGVTGLLVPPRDPKALGAAILEIVKDEQVRAKFGMAAREIVTEKFTREAAMGRIQDLYLGVLKERRAEGVLGIN
ncbi:glycosyltransferase family 4 protein [Candidatus Nitronereus thalassa]|uniref:Glycosyltransferase family 4 protein n=1 Tax=Candidatus Nitronereus thalassa TaxID=3020898 RepID=A0ABU3K5U9_9BACT|nr:glycosyltransferase family 4 protein [Candidatus Nitronereus thalassa]MDT7041804.1 glycosyltransferase family 4 protein [Candidatus Nitronereus thalassa]